MLWLILIIVLVVLLVGGIGGRGRLYGRRPNRRADGELGRGPQRSA